MTQMILDLVRMAWPATWTELYDRSAPLAIEIGFGNGLFLLNQARQRPDMNFLGIEIARPSIRRAANRLQAAGVANVRLIRASAESTLHLLCRPGSIQEVTINFPDPWPKAGHSDRRLISTSFLELLASRMAVGAKLDIATDHADYGQWIAGHLQASSYFESRLATAYDRQDADRVRTKYEKKGLAAGSACYYFKWRRNAVAAPTGYPLVEELPMPHVVVRSSLTLQEIADSFEPQQRTVEEVSIRFIDLYRSQRRASLIVDTYIAEVPLDQRLMLEIYRRPDGNYLIRLLATGFPRVTGGVHAAVAGLTEWLVGLDGQGQVIRHNLRVSLAT
jgi:tRNA (guanine-N7-)-methyltransferase